MAPSIERHKVMFPSADGQCAAWHYPGENGACVVMAAGLAVTKEPGTDRLAKRFQDAGYHVLAFDYRCLGESSGTSRQLVRFRDQLADYHAAVDFAATLPGVDRDKLAIWGFSASGGHALVIAARHPRVAAAIAHAPAVDGLHAMRNALRYMTPQAFTRLISRAAVDTVGGMFGRQPLLVPLAGERGAVAALTTPDSRNYVRALNPANRYPEWCQAVAARSAVRIGFYRPGRYVKHIRCPLLVVAYSDDGVAPPGPAIHLASRASRGQLALLPGGHYAAFLDGEAEAVQAMLSFLARALSRPGFTRDAAPRSIPRT